MAKADGSKTDKQALAIKAAVVVVVIVAVVVFAGWQQGKSRLVTLENQAIGHQNVESYDEAIKVYEELLPKLSSDADKTRVRKQLARCWKAKGDDPTLPLKEQIPYFKKALEYDPNCITDKIMLNAVKKAP